MRVWKERPRDLGYLFVVGGPGGSGVSTISKMLTRKYGLSYVYAGMFMRNLAKEKGFESVNEFHASDEFKKNSHKYDHMIDDKLIQYSFYPNVLIDSKVFAGIATNLQIFCTVKIWLDCSLEKRVGRTLHKQKKLDLSKRLSKRSGLYKKTSSKLMKRYSNDKNRFNKLYGIDYSSPEKYNDIVLDTSVLDEGETFNLVVKEIEDGGYIE